MKNMTFGELFWLIVGFLVLSIATVFIISQLTATKNELTSKKPSIPTPPPVSTTNFHEDDGPGATTPTYSLVA